MAHLTDRIRELLGEPAYAGSMGEPPLDDPSLERLLWLLCATRDDELSCDEVFNCLDEYVDCLEGSVEMGERNQLVALHISICADCQDELKALIHALENVAG
jgi:hypothetical protein